MKTKYNFDDVVVLTDVINNGEIALVNSFATDINGNKFIFVERDSSGKIYYVLDIDILKIGKL